MRRLRSLCAIVFLVGMAAFSQSAPKNSDEVYVDTAGVLRWRGTNNDVSLFGVNYTTPFAYSYRAHKRLGLSMKKAIDLDVAQMVRLGFDAFRVHVWDREISDEHGNLLANEHLDLLDYLLAKLADNGIKTIITPIAWWGNGWPEPDETTNGFSQSYTKPELMTNQKARAAQREYLREFIEHVNPYRKISYKNDPSIIATEIINEPHHPENAQIATEYINEMAAVLRNAGYTRPIFHNISENWSNEQANAVTRSNVEGISFQWYPTSLGHGKMLNGNYLINVNKYAIPSDSVVGFGKRAKMVYEFDAADVGGSYMYPAVARSFREAGMQFAAMFSYDPVQIAWSNTEYPTHYMNLLYAPSKALSAMIAAKAFRTLPMMKSYGNYPENNRFDDFRVSYEEDLSEMNSATEFIYSNSTKSKPKNAAGVKHVAGCGSSSVVQYDGTGAYFLDKMEEGIWRLEVYPDVLWLCDPFEVASMSRQAARLFWIERKLKIAIPELGDAYELRPLGEARQRSKNAILGSDTIKPGIYLVTAKTADKGKIGKYLLKKESFLDGLYTPPAVSSGIVVVNNSPRYMIASNQATFKLQIASEQKISNANLFIRGQGWRRFTKYVLKNVGGFDYVAADTVKLPQSGKIEYCVAVETNDGAFTFPEGVQNTPGRWDFSTNTLWSTKVIAPDEAIALVDVSRDKRDFVFPHYTRSMRYAFDYTNGSNSEEEALALKISFSDATPFGLQLGVPDLVKSLARHLDNYRHIVVNARSTQDSTCTIGIILLMSDGKSYGVDVEIKNTWQGIEIPLSAFRSKSALILPDSYPRFLPKEWNINSLIINDTPDLSLLQSVQIIADPSYLRRKSEKREIGFAITSVNLK